MSKRKISVIILGIIFLLIFFLASFIRTKYVVPILMYHQILPHPKPEYRLAVSIKTFQRQMNFLKKHHYNVMPLEELADLIRNRKKIPPRTIAITFDDGYRNNYIYVFWILKKYNLPATIFIIVNEVGRLNKKGLHDRLCWDEIKTMQASSLITFGSHALGPDPLTKIKSEFDLKKEIFDSKRILEERLGRKIPLFSYPEGRFNTKIRQMVIDAGYKCAVATNPGKKYPRDDIFALKRLRISETTKNMFVFWIETSGFYTFLKELRDED